MAFTNNLYKHIATLGYIGYLPVAPGTFGTASALLLIFLFRPDDFTVLLVFFAVFAAGLAASDRAEKQLGKDSKHIVIDEFCGYLLAVAFIPKSAGYLLTAFILFRVFDIFKPPPIKKIEEVVRGGAGIMLDDIAAAIYSNFCLHLLRYLL